MINFHKPDEKSLSMLRYAKYHYNDDSLRVLSDYFEENEEIEFAQCLRYRINKDYENFNKIRGDYLGRWLGFLWSYWQYDMNFNLLSCFPFINICYYSNASMKFPNIIKSLHLIRDIRNLEFPLHEDILDKDEIISFTIDICDDIIDYLLKKNLKMLKEVEFRVAYYLPSSFIELVKKLPKIEFTLNHTCMVDFGLEKYPNLKVI